MKTLTLILILLLQAMHANSQPANIITYNEKSKLEWTDFREINTSTDSVKQFYFSTTIQMKTVKVNVWTGVTTFEAYGVFIPSNSWVFKPYKTTQLLDYFQLQYDTANAVAKQLEKDINAKKINGGNKNKMGKVFKEYEARLNNILRKMDIETDDGKNNEIINNWKSKLSGGTILL